MYEGFVGLVFLDDNEVKEDILLPLDGIILYLNEMNECWMHIEMVVDHEYTCSHLDLITPSLAKVDTSHSN